MIVSRTKRFRYIFSRINVEENVWVHCSSVFVKGYSNSINIESATFDNILFFKRKFSPTHSCLLTKEFLFLLPRLGFQWKKRLWSCYLFISIEFLFRRNGSQVFQLGSLEIKILKSQRSRIENLFIKCIET